MSPGASPPSPALLPTTEPAAFDLLAHSAPNQWVIQLEEQTTEEQREQYLNSINATVEKSIEELDTVVVMLAAEVSLPVSSIVAVSEPNYYVTAMEFDPADDPLFAEQWALPVIGAPQAWTELLEDALMVTVAAGV